MTHTPHQSPQFVILIRFSFVGKGDWVRWRKEGRGSREIADIVADLYATERIERRFRSFETLTLASLTAQTDQDFRVIVLTSPLMPEVYQERLQALCTPHKNIRVLFSDAPSVVEALTPALQELHDTCDRLVQLRLDDDDALSVNFIARLRAHAQIMAAYPHYAITMSQGLLLKNWDNNRIEFSLVTRPFIGIGVAACLPDNRCIFEYTHAGLGKHLISLQDVDGASFIHQCWSAGDTYQGEGITRHQEREIPLPRIARIINREFPFLAKADLGLLKGQGGGPQ